MGQKYVIWERNLDKQFKEGKWISMHPVPIPLLFYHFSHLPALKMQTILAREGNAMKEGRQGRDHTTAVPHQLMLELE